MLSAAQIRGAMRAAIEGFAKIDFAVSVPGTHSSGPSYNELLGYLADDNRNFTAVTKQLRDFVKARLSQEFLNASETPLRIDLEGIRREAVVEFLQARMLRKVRDVSIRALLADTIKQKRRLGYSNPALPGYATGELHENLARLRVIESR
jgi:hypothetical protein